MSFTYPLVIVIFGKYNKNNDLNNPKMRLYMHSRRSDMALSAIIDIREHQKCQLT